MEIVPNTVEIATALIIAMRKYAAGLSAADLANERVCPPYDCLAAEDFNDFLSARTLRRKTMCGHSNSSSASATCSADCATIADCARAASKAALSFAAAIPT